MQGTTAPSQAGPGVDAVAVTGDRFRQALAKFPTGVAVLTTAGSDDRRVGLTVSSFNSVSISPPLILWSISRATQSFPAFRDASYFCVNVLCEQQVELARHFARPCSDKFATISHVVHSTGVPIIADCASHLICRTWNQYDGGDHVIIVGEVIDLETSNGAPLVFGVGLFCRLLLDPPLGAEGCR